MAVVIMSTMMTQTMGKAIEASIIATSRHGLFLILFLLILSPLLGIIGIQLSTPMAEIASFIIVIPIMRRVFRQLSVPDGESELRTT
jgi:Na+-driven multidrug efflux pump